MRAERGRGRSGNFGDFSDFSEFEDEAFVEKPRRAGKGRGGRKKKRAVLRRLLPIAVAIGLIMVVLLFCLISELVKRFSYSQQEADLREYFSLESDDQAAILMDNEYIEEKAYMADGRFYVNLEFARENICDNYYYDPFEEVLLHTLADRTVSSDRDSGDFILQGDEAYLALDYLERLGKLSVTVYDSEPGRAHLELVTGSGEAKLVMVRSDSEIREKGGIKSDILTRVERGDAVELLDPMDEWSCVKSSDGYIGYIENKRLGVEKTVEIEAPKGSEDSQIVHNLRDHRICLGWHQVMSKDANSTLGDVISGKKGMNVISPTWFSIADSTGGVTSIGTTDYVEKAHAAGLEVWALVDNFNIDDTYEVLGPTSIRRILIGNLIREATELGVDGINVDFETLKSECGPAFAQFIRELSVECRREGLVLSVDNYVPRGHTAFYDRKTQGEYADYVVIMGYDEHYMGSEESGSVASFNFVQEGIESTLMDVDSSQVINGIPFYTRIWHEGTELTSDAVGMAAAKEFLSNHGMTAEWNEECAQNYAEKTEGKTTHRVWIEDARSIGAKLDLMKANNLAGVACWKLGLETSDIWDVIGAYMQ